MIKLYSLTIILPNLKEKSQLDLQEIRISLITVHHYDQSMDYFQQNLQNSNDL